MKDILPIFTTNFSVGRSILTTEKSSNVKPNGPSSIFSIAKKYQLSEIYIADNSFSGFFEIYRTSLEEKVNPHFGLKIVVTEDGNKKDESSLANQYKIIIWVRNSQGYRDLLGIHNLATTNYFYYTPRCDEKLLKERMTENLLITIPFYDSFIFQNLMGFASCNFDCDYFKPAFHIENNDLPFDPIIKAGIENFNKDNRFEIIPSKTIYYAAKSDFLAYSTFRCINNRTTLDSPNISHFSSDRFNFEDYIVESSK